MDGTLGAEYFSKRGWAQRGEFRARPSNTSYVDLNYFGVMDRGIVISSGNAPVREGGQEVRLTSEGSYYGFRAVSDVDYLSSFLFRLAFNEVFTQAINSEVKSQLFLSKNYKGFSFGGVIERYQDFFQTVSPSSGTLSNPPTFDSIRILHTPSIELTSVDRPLWHLPLLWSVDTSISGLSRTEPGFHTSSLLGRVDLSPEISLPLHFWGWSLRPAIDFARYLLHATLRRGDLLPMTPRIATLWTPRSSFAHPAWRESSNANSLGSNGSTSLSLVLSIAR